MVLAIIYHCNAVPVVHVYFNILQPSFLTCVISNTTGLAPLMNVLF